VTLGDILAAVSAPGRIAVGIDLGAANSAACVFRDGELTTVPTPEGGVKTPSAVYFGRRGEVLVGRPALVHGQHRPDRLMAGWKRHLANPSWEQEVDGRKLTPVLLAALVLRRLATNVRAFTGTEVRHAVLAVPTLFGDLTRGLVLDAARIAGIQSPRLINEPTAAALDFARSRGASSAARRILVVSMGAGNLGVSIVELADGAVRVRGTAGERSLGGNDWDGVLLDLVAEEVYERVGVDPREDALATAELAGRVVAVKTALTTEPSATIDVPVPFQRRTLSVTVTREAFAARTRSLVERIEAQLELVAEAARVKWGELDLVLATGGATAMPMVQELLRRVTQRDVVRPPGDEETVARGAAIYGALLAGDVSLEVDLGGDLGSTQETRAPATRAPKARSRPARSEDSGRLAVEPGFESDETLPMLPGAIGPTSPLEEVTSEALGILVVGRSGPRNSIMIPAQSVIPAERKREFVTVKDGQTTVKVKVLEGSHTDPARCVLVGDLVVSGFPADRPKGQAIEVFYGCDQDGRIQVSARDKASGMSAQAVIERRGAISSAEIARLREEVASKVG
jgi:molecular chaperone DnaK (HSP70)